jgi:foldase protein PrsA
MFNDQRKAIEAWEELKKDPSLFEKLARDRSIDPSTASVGGMLPHPITRHAYPRHVSDAAFEQLVDGSALDSKLADVEATTPEEYKPKDGDLSGVIQVSEASWIILRREGLIPARPYDPNDQAVREELRKALFDAKLQEEVALVWNDIMNEAAIENRLTGNVKPSGEPMPGLAATPDDQVQRTTGAAAAGDVAAPTGPKLPTPAGVSSADAQQAEALKDAPKP